MSLYIKSSATESWSYSVEITYRGHGFISITPSIKHEHKPEAAGRGFHANVLREVQFLIKPRPRYVIRLYFSHSINHPSPADETNCPSPAAEKLGKKGQLNVWRSSKFFVQWLALHRRFLGEMSSTWSASQDSKKVFQKHRFSRLWWVWKRRL